MTFSQLKDCLIPYLVEMNYTHVEFMPLMAHPLDMSWGYQLMGYFAFEHTYGTPEEFQDFVEACHKNNIGVLVDWVPGHFIQNDDALAYFDGTATYEYQNHDRAHNYRWGALNFDLGKNQVQSFLISSALFWIEHYHIDGIRVDAVSNMLYLDYDEVVHGKKSMMHKMWGDRYNQFAGLRNLYAYQMCHPGKKLLFMGSEFGQFLEWKYNDQLEWGNLNDDMNQKMQRYTKQLNQFYKDYKCLWRIDDSFDGLEIIDADNKSETVLSFIRKDDKGDLLLCVFNMTPVERPNFTIGVPRAGIYEEVLNTEMEEFGGVWKNHNPVTKTQVATWKDYDHTLSFTLPALGASVWRIKRRLRK